MAELSFPHSIALPLLDKAYKSAMGMVPEWLQKYDIGMPVVFGLAGSASVVRGTDALLHHMGVGIRARKAVNRVFYHGSYLVPIIYSFLDNSGAQEAISLHPSYASGLAGVAGGTFAVAGHNLSRIKGEEKLESKVGNLL